MGGHTAEEPIGVDVLMVDAQPGGEHREDAEVVLVHAKSRRVDESVFNGRIAIGAGVEVHPDADHVAGQGGVIGPLAERRTPLKGHDRAS